MSLRLPLVGILFLCGSMAGAADWPQFRGPHRDGLSAETGLLQQWPKGGPKLVWSFKKAGLGYSSMSIVDGTLYTLGSRGDDEIVLALDAVKGTELWTVKLGPIVNAWENKQWGDGPRATPTIDGKHLYALGSQGALLCLDLATGKPKEVWRKDLLKDFGGEMMTGWGYSESPLIDGKLLLVTPGGDKGTLAALDKFTGALVWRSTELKQSAPYTSVMAADFNSSRQYIQASYAGDKEGGYLNGFAAKDGKLLWSEQIYKGSMFLIASNPLIKDNLVYHSNANNCHLFEIGKDDKPKDRYTKKSGQKNMKNNHGGVVLLGDHVYGYSHGRGWACQEFAEGQLKWEEPGELACNESGAMIAGDGMLYMVTDLGEVGLAKADPTGFNLTGSFKMPELSKYRTTRKTSVSSKVWSHPAIANGHLYVRDCEFVYCYDVKK
jgi:outer membrane protein assembly factor BamB